MKCRGLLYKFPCLFFCKIPSKSVDFIPFLTEYPADCQSDSELAPVTIAALLMIYVLLVHSLC